MREWFSLMGKMVVIYMDVVLRETRGSEAKLGAKSPTVLGHNSEFRDFYIGFINFPAHCTELINELFKVGFVLVQEL